MAKFLQPWDEARTFEKTGTFPSQHTILNVRLEDFQPISLQRAVSNQGGNTSEVSQKTAGRMSSSWRSKLTHNEKTHKFSRAARHFKRPPRKTSNKSFQQMKKGWK